MFGQLRNGTISGYGAAGQEVIGLYHQLNNTHKYSDSEIRSRMEERIQSIHDESDGQRTVSNHLGDPKVKNVFDVAPSSIPANQRRDFEAALDQAKKDGAISLYHGPNTPAKDPAYHIEILQPKTK